MAVLGADPDQLRNLAKQMRVSDRVIVAAAKRIGAQLRSGNWSGADADDFGARWRSHEAQLVSSAELLRRASEDLERNAFEQEHASAAAAGPSPRGEPGPLPAKLDVAELDALEVLPVKTFTFWADAEVAAALGIASGSRVTIEYMADGTAILWVETKAGLDGDTGVGAELGADGAGLEVSASAGISITGTLREGWILDRRDLESLGRDVMFESAASPAGRLLDLVIGGPGLGTMWAALGNGPGKALLDQFGQRAGLGFGEPDFDEASVGLQATTGAGLAAGVPVAGAGIVAAGSAGIRRGPEGDSLVISGRGRLEGELGTARQGAVAQVGVEVPLRAHGPVDVTVTTTTVQDGEYTISQDTYRVPESEIRDVVEGATAGNAPGSARETLDILNSFGEPTHHVETHGHGQRHGVDDLGATVTAGLKGEATFGLGYELVDYGPLAEENPHDGFAAASSGGGGGGSG